MLSMAKKQPKRPPTPFGLRLKARREAAGMTLAALGGAIGTDRQAIYRFENSPDANPSLTTLQKLADALGCTPNDLMGYGETPPVG